MANKGYKLTKGSKVSHYKFERYYGLNDPSNIDISSTNVDEVFYVDGFSSKRAFHKYLKANGLLLTQQ